MESLAWLINSISTSYTPPRRTRATNASFDRIQPSLPTRPTTMPGLSGPTSPRQSSVSPGPTTGQPARAAATLAEVIETVRTHPDLAPTRRRDLISALRTTARLCHMSPAQLPAEPRDLRHRLRDLHPAAVGMSGKRFRNVTGRPGAGTPARQPPGQWPSDAGAAHPGMAGASCGLPNPMVPVAAGSVHAVEQRAGHSARHGRDRRRSTRS